jgi:hypothetical protein
VRAYERPGDGDTLLLAARKLVREAVELVDGEPDTLDEFGDSFVPLSPGVADVVDLERPADDIASPTARIQARAGVLKDDLDLLAELAHPTRRGAVDALAVVMDLASGRLEQSEHRLAERGLPTARLTDQPRSLAVFDGKATTRLTRPPGRNPASPTARLTSKVTAT